MNDKKTPWVEIVRILKNLGADEDAIKNIRKIFGHHCEEEKEIICPICEDGLIVPACDSGRPDANIWLACKACSFRTDTENSKDGKVTDWLLKEIEMIRVILHERYEQIRTSTKGQAHENYSRELGEVTALLAEKNRLVKDMESETLKCSNKFVELKKEIKKRGELEAEHKLQIEQLNLSNESWSNMVEKLQTTIREQTHLFEKSNER